MVKTLCISCAIYANQCFLPWSSTAFIMTWYQSNAMSTNQDVCLFAVSLNDNFVWSIDLYWWVKPIAVIQSMMVHAWTLYSQLWRKRFFFYRINRKPNSRHQDNFGVVLFLLIYCFIYLPLSMGVLWWSLFWYALLCVLSSFVIILRRGRELVALKISCCC